MDIFSLIRVNKDELKSYGNDHINFQTFEMKFNDELIAIPMMPGPVRQEDKDELIKYVVEDRGLTVDQIIYNKIAYQIECCECNLHGLVVF